MRNFSTSSLLSFELKSFLLSGIIRKPITASLIQNGELTSLKAKSGGIFHISPGLTAG